MAFTSEESETEKEECPHPNCPNRATLVTPSAAVAEQICFGKPATIVGTAGDDRLVGTKKADVIVGLAGSDNIQGEGGNDRICANRGDDFVAFGTDYGFGPGFFPVGELGERGNDRLSAGRGNDNLGIGRGDDLLVGGPGKDTAAFHRRNVRIMVNLATGRGVANGHDSYPE